MEKVRIEVGNGFIVGDLYRPEGASRGGRCPAVVVGGSLTAVKEMMGGAYATQLAGRGYLALSIDYRNYGESSGTARQYEDPLAKAEDLVAAVDFLANRPDVHMDRVGLVGVCTSGGNVLYGAVRSNQVAYVACIASHLAEPAVTPTLYGGDDGVAQRLISSEAARAEFERTGSNATILAYHDKDVTASHVGPMEYYMDRARGGGVPAWRNGFAVMSWKPWLAFDPVAEAEKVTAPTIVVHSDACALPVQARKVYDRLGGAKSLHWTEGVHFDFYDNPSKIAEALDAVDDFFRAHRPR